MTQPECTRHLTRNRFVLQSIGAPVATEAVLVRYSSGNTHPPGWAENGPLEIGRPPLRPSTADRCRPVPVIRPSGTNDEVVKLREPVLATEEAHRNRWAHSGGVIGAGKSASMFLTPR